MCCSNRKYSAQNPPIVRASAKRPCFTLRPPEWLTPSYPERVRVFIFPGRAAKTSMLSPPKVLSIF